MADISIDWTVRNPFPERVKGAVLAIVGSDLIHAGGITEPWDQSDRTYRYDWENDRWEIFPAIPQGLPYTQGAAWNEQLVILGSRHDGRAQRTCWRFINNGGKKEWSAFPDMLAARAGGRAVVVGSHLYAIGGGDWSQTHPGAFYPREVNPAIERCDLSKEPKWESVEFPVSPGVAHFAACAQGRLYLFGGYDCWVENDQRQVRTMDHSWCFDPKEEKWQELKPTPLPMHGGAAVTVNDRYIVLVGGVATDGGPKSERLISEVDDPYREDVKIGSYAQDVHVYDIVAGQFSVLEEKVPYGFNDIGLIFSGDRLITVGGESIDKTTSNTSNLVLSGVVTLG